MQDDVVAMRDAVKDERSLLLFMQALAADWESECRIASITPSSPHGAGANGWENGTIGAYLEAAASWGEASIDGLPQAGYAKPDNPWRRVAQILYMGKIYE